MMRFLKIALVVAAATIALPASAFDFGADITNDSVLAGSGPDLALAQTNQVVAWASLPIGASSSLYASALYEFSGDFTYLPAASNAIRWYSFTAGRVEWEGFLSLGSNSSLKWSVGRIPFQDYSSRVVNGLLDGAKAELAFGSLQTSLSVAYTGLTFKEDAKIVIDADDETRLADTTVGWPADFANNRLVASVGARFIELLPKHDFGFDGWAQFDLGPAGSVITNTQYAEPFIEGRIGRALRWRLWGAAEFGQDPAFFYAMAAGGRLRLALPEALGLRITATSAWAGGDYDAAGSMRAFKPITMGSMSTIGGTLFSDALGASLDASVTLLRGLSLGLACAADFLPQDAVPYRGIEASGHVTYRPVSDFTITVGGGAYMPNVAASPGSVLSWQASASASVKL